MAQPNAGRPARGAYGKRRRVPVETGRQVYAALDLGTNNCRLLVARPAAGGFRVIDAFSRIVRLGEGVGRSGELTEAAIERTVAALAVCARKMRRRGATRTRNVATAACRLARNCDDFLFRVEQQTGIALEIISTGEEARLSVAGCSPLLDGHCEHALVFDIGGGSTELTWVTGCPGADPVIEAWMSLPHGVVSLAEIYGGDAISGDTFEAMVALVRSHLQPFEDRHGLNGHVAAGALQMLGTSGTVTTLAGIHLELERYDRSRVDGLWMRFDDAASITRRLLGMNYEERATHPCIGRERADLVLAGCAILEGICRTWPVGRLRVGDRGLREGMILSMIRNDRRHASARQR